MPVECPNCHAENRDNAEVCIICNASLIAPTEEVVSAFAPLTGNPSTAGADNAIPKNAPASTIAPISGETATNNLNAGDGTWRPSQGDVVAKPDQVQKPSEQIASPTLVLTARWQEWTVRAAQQCSTFFTRLSPLLKVPAFIICFLLLVVLAASPWVAQTFVVMLLIYSAIALGIIFLVRRWRRIVRKRHHAGVGEEQLATRDWLGLWGVKLGWVWARFTLLQRIIVVAFLLDLLLFLLFSLYILVRLASNFLVLLLLAAIVVLGLDCLLRWKVHRKKPAPSVETTRGKVKLRGEYRNGRLQAFVEGKPLQPVPVELPRVIRKMKKRAREPQLPSAVNEGDDIEIQGVWKKKRYVKIKRLHNFTTGIDYKSW